MMIIPLVILLILMVIRMEWPTLQASQSKRDHWVFLISLLFTASFVICYGLDLINPNPTAWIKKMYEPITVTFFGN